MKKSDNFNIKQWLTENKVTTQSRLNELPSNFSFTQDDVIEMALEKGLISKENVEQPEVLKALRTAFSRFTPEDNPTLEDAYRMFKYHL